MSTSIELQQRIIEAEDLLLEDGDSWPEISSAIELSKIAINNSDTKEISVAYEQLAMTLFARDRELVLDARDTSPLCCGK